MATTATVTALALPSLGNVKTDSSNPVYVTLPKEAKVSEATVTIACTS